MTKLLPNELVIISKATLDKLFKAGEESEYKSGTLIALYGLYNYTCKWQETNQVWANDMYVGIKLGIGPATARKYRRKLQEMGLIESIKQKKAKDGRFAKPYVKVKHIFRTETVEEITEQENTDIG